MQVVVDLTHHKVMVSQGQVNPPLLVGLNHHCFYSVEPQTIESINSLKRGKVTVVVALNKVDCLLDWKRNPLCSVHDNLKKQKSTSASQFNELYKQVVGQFAEQVS